MSDYTPTTEDMRLAWAVDRGPEADAEFDRWMADHDRQLRAETAKVLRNWAKHLMGYREGISE